MSNSTKLSGLRIRHVSDVSNDLIAIYVAKAISPGTLVN